MKSIDVIYRNQKECFALKKCYVSQRRYNLDAKQKKEKKNSLNHQVHTQNKKRSNHYSTPFGSQDH